MLKRLIQGIGANFLGQVINVASRVLLVPLFLTAWGAQVYGEWLILSSVVAYLSLTDLGGQLYIVNRLTQAYAQKDIPLCPQDFTHRARPVSDHSHAGFCHICRSYFPLSPRSAAANYRHQPAGGLSGPGYPGLPVRLFPAPGHLTGGLSGRGAVAPGSDAHQHHAVGYP